MRQVTAPGRPVTGRWIWVISGVVTATFLAVGSGWLITRAGIPQPATAWSAIPTRTTLITEPVTGVNVQSYGAPIQVTTGSGPGVTVSEAIAYGEGGGPPAVTASVSHGLLTLAAPDCGGPLNCSVGFAVTVPRGIAVVAASGGGNIAVEGATTASLDSGGGAVIATGITKSLLVSSEGGPVSADGVAEAVIDSGGGGVRAIGVDGQLTAATGGAPLTVAGLTGPLYADTGGGDVVAQGVNATTATVLTAGGNVRVVFASAPDRVQVSTAGGGASLSVPGGPYALITDDGGGPQLVRIATNTAAARSISVFTSGGPLTINSAAAAGRGSGSVPVPQKPVPPKPPAPPGQ